ncbi:MAG TPA: extracellular solute-binding protein [Clostridiaceae bacterium]|nr:extracellular solute-binding protein [Clostridiaceae bacterium]
MEKKFPGITINYVDKGWADVLRENLMLATMGGNSPDVGVGEDFIPEFARIGALTELPQEMAKDLAEGPISAAWHDGKLYAVASMTGVLGLVYNKDVLHKAGLTENDIPKTWDEWLDVSRKITEAGKGEFYGTVVQNNQLGGTFRIIPFIRQLGGDYTTPDWSKVTFNTPEVLKALTFLRELSKTAPPGSTSLNDEGALYVMVNTGKVCFYVNGPWFIAWSKSQTPAGNIGYAPLPLPEGGKRANVIIGNTLWYVLKQSKNQEAAIEFVRILASREYQEKMSVATSRLPANIEAAKNPELLQKVPEMAVYAEIVANEPASPLPVYPKNGPKIWETWYKVQDVVLISDNPIEKALEEAQKTAEELLK